MRIKNGLINRPAEGPAKTTASKYHLDVYGNNVALSGEAEKTLKGLFRGGKTEAVLNFRFKRTRETGFICYELNGRRLVQFKLTDEYYQGLQDGQRVPFKMTLQEKGVSLTSQQLEAKANRILNPAKRIYPTIEAATAALLLEVEASGGKYVVEMTTTERMRSGKALVHIDPIQIDFGVKSDGQPYKITIYCRVWPRTRIGKGSKYRVLVTGISKDKELTLWKAGEIAGEVVPMKGDINYWPPAV